MKQYLSTAARPFHDMGSSKCQADPFEGAESTEEIILGKLSYSHTKVQEDEAFQGQRSHERVKGVLTEAESCRSLFN